MSEEDNVNLSTQEVCRIVSALVDALELLDERLECGRKHGDYEEEDMAEMRADCERYSALLERFDAIRKERWERKN